MVVEPWAVRAVAHGGRGTVVMLAVIATPMVNVRVSGLSGGRRR
jgi:hypothetical protein